MSKLSTKSKEQIATELKTKVSKLKAQLALVKKQSNETIQVRVTKTDAHFYSVPNQKKSDDLGLGKYLLLVEVKAGIETLYIPTTIASGRKSAGFIYQIEGTTSSSSTATISVKGDGIVTVTSGTISYCKIPVGKVATLKIQAEVTGAEGKTYKVVVSRINYKLNPNDLRYKRFLTEISTKTLMFR